MGDTSVCSLFGHGPKGDNLLVKPRLFMLQSSYSKRQRWRSSGLSTLKFIWKDNSVWQPSNLMQIKKRQMNAVHHMHFLHRLRPSKILNVQQMKYLCSNSIVKGCKCIKFIIFIKSNQLTFVFHEIGTSTYQEL